jgi:hypothetical protein
MPNTYAEVLAAASLFDDAHKLELADELYRQMRTPDPAIEEAWRKEVEKRMASYDAGLSTARSLDEVLAEMAES